MKRILMAAAVCFSLTAAGEQVSAQTRIIETSVSRPVSGPGGWSELKYTFEKGETVRLHYSSQKLLDRVNITMGSNQLLVRKTATKKGDLEFIVPNTGEVTIRFINDRNGHNSVNYEVTTVGSADGTPVVVH